MSEWKVYYTDKAENDLGDVYEYIAYTLLAPETAKGQANRIMDAADELDHMPYRFPLYDDEPWHSRGLRKMPVDNYIVYYLPIEAHKLVAIVRVIYGGSDTKSKLKNTKRIDLKK